MKMLVVVPSSKKKKKNRISDQLMSLCLQGNKSRNSRKVAQTKNKSPLENRDAKERITQLLAKIITINRKMRAIFQKATMNYRNQ